MLERLSKIREKLRGLTAREAGAEALLRAQRYARRAIDRASDRPDATYITDSDLKRSMANVSPASALARLRKRAWPHLTVGLSDLARTAQVIKELFPDAIEEAGREADHILAHRITLFGRAFDFGPQIDWHADPATGARWPLKHFSHTGLLSEAKRPLKLEQEKEDSLPQQERNPYADVRVVWELNRLHHFVILGRAYALTGDERYTEEFLIQLASWYEENPPRFGVNWTVAMEVAIRAINFIAAMDLFRASKLMTDDAFALIWKTLIAHGRFIRANLEFSHRTLSNHYLSNLIGLYSIGMMLPDLGESREWAQFSAPRLLEEMERQVYRDGVDYEGATGYHRLVLEIFMAFFAISRASQINLPARCWHRLEAMFEFVRYYLKPDGTAPLIGDSDDGRLIKFKERPAVDHSYLMPIAAILFENGAFKQSRRLDEEALWWFGDPGREQFERLPSAEDAPSSRAFQEAQIFIEREGPLYAIVDCGDHGAGGRGSHAHADALSIEVFAYDRTFLRDPGTFVYTASERWRNLFRSTAYHNTVRVDGKDISRISEGHPFALGPNVKPVVNRWESTGERDLLDAEHYGYVHGAQPVVHGRVVTFDKREGYWTIEDRFTGKGSHRLEFFFNFDAGLEIEIDSELRAIALGGDSRLAIVPVSDHPFEMKEEERWVSLSYGTRARASAIIYSLRALLPFENIMLVVPYRRGEEAKIAHARSAIRGQLSGVSYQLSE
ncbi:MAG: heparinase II/III family protein [Blastocatellia bacterium]|nr:heparinase II/III family protein [Blastocatellia bacterium]